MFFKIGVITNVGRPAILTQVTPTQVFSGEICEIFKNNFFYRTPVAASDPHCPTYVKRIRESI